MFLVWGSRWKYEAVPGGMRVEKRCPECDRTGVFVEVKPTRYFTLYWLPLFELERKRTVLECPFCKSCFYIKEDDYRAAKKDEGSFRDEPFSDHASGHRPDDRGGECGVEKPSSHPRAAGVRAPVERKEIACPCCGRSIRIPVLEQLIQATCPHCKKQFHVASGELL